MGFCRLQLTSLSSIIVLQLPLLCEGYVGRFLRLSGDSSVLMDLRWSCDGTAQISILSIGSASLVLLQVPVGSLSRGGDVVVYVKDINQPSLPTPFYSVLVSISVFMALSTVFHTINSTDKSPFSHSVLLVLFLPYWSFQLYISL